MNERIQELFNKASVYAYEQNPGENSYGRPVDENKYEEDRYTKFAELIVKEMCGMMEQAEDDAYHCFEPSERPTEYIEWLKQWRTRFEEHFGVE